MGTSLRKAWTSLNPPAKARVCLGIAAIVLLLFLIFSAKPWSVDLDAINKLKTSHYVKLWFWPGCLFAFLVVCCLGVFADWWTKPLRSVPGIVPRPECPRWFWPLTLGAAIFLGACAWARLDQSLWHDEASRTRSTMVGSFRESGDGTLKFRRIDWEDALFDSRLPNHVFQSALSKVSHDIWLKVGGTKSFPLSEPALRFPTWVFAIACIVLMAVLLLSLGSAGAGVICAWLLALHPWYLRYSGEARGYMIVMALLPVLILAFMRAVQTGKTRWWVLMGLAQMVMIYSYVAALYIPLVLNLLALFVMLSQVKNGLDFWRMIPKWVVTNVLSATAFLLLFLPNVPQLLAYLHSEKGQGLGNVMNELWTQNFFSQLASGVVWTNSHLVESPYIELFPQWHHHPVLFQAGIFLLVLLVAIGIVAAARMNVYAFLACLVFLLPAALSYTETKLRGGFLHEWYLVYLVPGVVALVAIALARLVPPSGKPRLLGLVAVVSITLLYALWTQPQRMFLLRHSIQPYREAVLLTRPSLDPNAPGQEKILTAFVKAGPLYYDPRIERCWKVEDIKNLIQKADAEDKTLFFNLTYLETVQFEHPSKYRLISNPALFDEVGFVVGFQPLMSHRIFRYIAGSGRQFDFSQYPDDVGPD